MMLMMIANSLSRIEIPLTNPNSLAVHILLVYRTIASSIFSGGRAIAKETTWPSFIEN